MKKNYIAPTSKVHWVGLRRNLADFDVYGGHVSAQVKEENVWGNDATPSGSTSSKRNSLWDDEW